MSRAFRRGPAVIHANMTPMIDVTFLLIVFFVLVSRIVEVESVEMALPQLVDPATVRPQEEERVVVNVVPGADRTASEYRVGARAFPAGEPGESAVAAHLAGLLAANPELRVNVRADRRTRYEWVRPALRAIAAAAADAGARRGAPIAPRVNLVIVREEGRDG